MENRIMPAEVNQNKIQGTLIDIEKRVDKLFEKGVSLRKNTKILENGTVIERDSTLDKKGDPIQRAYALRRKDDKSGKYVYIRILQDYQNKQRIPATSEISSNERVNVRPDQLDESELGHMLEFLFLGVKI